MLVSQLINDKINEDLGWIFVNFHLIEKNWANKVEKVLNNIIWCHLFNNRELVGKALRKEFHQVALLTPDCLKIAFSRSYNIDPEKFMKAIKFEITINKVHQNWFTTAIHEMTNSKKMRLIVLIIGLEFFGRSQISVDLLNKEDDPCIQSNTCFSQLHLPPYSSYEAIV
jgi:hypothetical protein